MLKVSNLRKEFDSVTAVDDVSLEVQRGELFGLLGPNGAGKTTTIRTVLNIIEPDGGSILFDGKPFTPQLWNSIGYLPEERGLYRKSRIMNTILYFAALKGLSAVTAKPLVYRWLERFNLADAGSRRIEELSKGNQQKIQLIIALIHTPQLLVLDEPFSGLDPVNQILLKDILLEIRKDNTAIIFSTHQMEQVEKMCDNICLINKGKVVLGGAISAVKKKYGTNSIRLEYEGEGAFLKSLPIVRKADVYQNYAEIELTDMSKSRELLAKLDGKLALRKFEIVEPSLNSIFVSVVGVQDEPAPEMMPTPAVALRPSLIGDKRILRAMLSAGAMFVATVVVAMREFIQPEPNWTLPGIFLAATAISVFRFMKTRSAVLLERATTGGGTAQ